MPALPIDRTVEGSVDADSPRIESDYLKAIAYPDLPARGVTYSFRAPSAGTFHVAMQSHAFNAYLVLRGEAGTIIDEDDNDLFGKNAMIEFSADEPDQTFTIDATALQSGAGDFALRVTAGEAPRRNQAESLQLAMLEARRGSDLFEDAPPSAEKAWSKLALVRALMHSGRRAEAEPILREVEDLRRELHGPEHPLTIELVDERGSIALYTGDFDRARALFEEQLAARRRQLGPSHLTVASTLNNLGYVYGRMGEYLESLSYYEESLEIIRPHESHCVENSLLARDGRAQHLQLTGRVEESRRAYEENLALCERWLRPDHPLEGSILCGLGLLLKNIGEHQEAAESYRRARTILARSLGEEHPFTATTMGNLAEMLLRSGDHVESRRLYERQLRIYREAFGERNANTLLTRTNLAELLVLTGDVEEAVAELEELMPLLEELLGADHPQTRTSQAILASCYSNRGRNDEALVLLEQLEESDVKRYGYDHPTTLTTRSRLADLLDRTGRSLEALERHREILEIRRRVAGRENLLTSNSLNFVASSLARLGRFDEALEHAIESHELTERLIGPDRSRTAQRAHWVSRICAETGDWERARKYALSAFEGSRNHVLQMMAAMPEAERFRLMAGAHRHLEFLLALARHRDDPDWNRESYEALLSWKGVASRLQITSRRQMLAGVDPAQRELVDELHSAQSRLSALALTESSFADPEREQRLADLRRKRADLERALFRDEVRTGSTSSVRFAELRDGLPPDSAVVDFFTHGQYRPGALHRSVRADSHGMSEARLLAWITRPDRPTVTRIDLGPASTLETATHEFLADLVVGRGNAMATEGEQDDRVADRLRELLWDPIEPHVTEVETVFVSPERFLGVLPFETLQSADGIFLIERHAFVYTQDVLGLPAAGGGPDSDFGSLLAVGGVDFGNRSEHVPEPVAQLSRGSFDGYWGRLPATTYEAQVAVDLHTDLFGAEAPRLHLVGRDAHEDRIKQEIAGYSVLHLATHGFFQPEGHPSMWKQARGEEGAVGVRLDTEDRLLISKYPGLMTGLVLAGANRATDPDREDGFLTAEEVGWLDLEGVELVVLSACDTGLGTEEAGEGLMGLRRAFQMAGARTVISSMWSVKDESTSKLMRSFYVNLWAKGMGRGEALRRAQLDLLLANRAEHGRAIPSTWGAFVLSGDWR